MSDYYSEEELLREAIYSIRDELKEIKVILTNFIPNQQESQIGEWTQ
jgi:hypothetical protein